jgi:hypothetical protein
MDSPLIAFVFKETYLVVLYGENKKVFAVMNKKEIGFRSKGTYDV